MAGVLTLSGLLGGCAGRGDIDLLESRLREQEDLIRAVQGQLSTTRDQLRLARQEADLLRANLASLEQDASSIVQVQALVNAAGITIHPLLTSGQNVDAFPGDDRVHAVVVPHDLQGEALRLAGELDVEAVDGSNEGRSLGKQTYSQDQLRGLWHTGLLASGYQVDVPLRGLPQGNDVVLRVTLRLPDGREFVASREVAIDPPGIGADEAFPPRAIPSADRSQVPDDGPSLGEAGRNPPVVTSDNWTDETIPIIR